MLKRTLLLTAVGASTATIAPQARAGEMYPYIAPQSDACSQIVPPKGAGAYFFSEDCKTTFVLPPPEGTSSVRALMITTSATDCRAYTTSKSNVAKMEEVLSQKVAEYTLLGLPDDDPKSVALKQSLESIQQMIAKLRGNYSKVSAATAQVVYKSNMDQKYLMDWIGANLIAFQEKDVKFVPAPISESYVSFTGVARDSVDSDEVVVSSQIPGFTTKRESSGTTVVASDVFSGQLKLGLGAVCLNAQAGADGRLSMSKKDLSSYLVATRTYSVPLKTSVGYRASLDIENTLKLFSNSNIVRTQFTTKDVVDIIGSGTANDVFKFDFDGFEAPAGVITDDAKKNFFAELREGVTADFARRLLDRMIEGGVIKVETAQITPGEAQGGFTTRPEVRRQCRRKKGPFGLWDNGEECWNETYSIPVWNDGVANRVVTQSDQTKYTIKDDVSVKGIIYRPYTQVYVEQPSTTQGE